MKFLDKFLSSIPMLNRWLMFGKKRLNVVVEGEDVDSSQLRTTVNVKFFSRLETLGKEQVHNGFVLKGTSADTNSMDPGIDGHIVMLVPLGNEKPYRFKDLKVGDIIWFRRRLDNTENVLHRIIETQEDYVICRGDNNVIPDGVILEKDVKGVCVGVIY